MNIDYDMNDSKYDIPSYLLHVFEYSNITEVIDLKYDLKYNLIMYLYYDYTIE